MQPEPNPTADLREAIAAATAELHPAVPAPSLERPPRPEFGDYSTNVAMLAAPLIGEPPRDVAAKLTAPIDERLGDSVERIEVAGPGFLNLHMAEGWVRDAAAFVAARGRRFGSGIVEQPESILVEFISANPTGPLTVASGRHLAYGDSLARVLEFAGHSVEREY
ncbi:MAG TPA: arginine--tRNA ligase, partial [Solirubrobacterales bacterium]|nr:arginine--tRNA ligase [Solirubrobacterales bacterium]